MKTRKHDGGCTITTGNGNFCTCATTEPKQAEHTPTPWRLDKQNPSLLRDAKGLYVAKISEELPADAAFIVRAVNAHEALLKALKACVASLQRDTEDFGHEVAHINYAIRDAEQAIARAEGT